MKFRRPLNLSSKPMPAAVHWQAVLTPLRASRLIRRDNPTPAYGMQIFSSRISFVFYSLSVRVLGESSHC